MNTLLIKSVKGMAWLTVSRLLSLAFGVISTIFIVRWLGPDEYGYLPLISSILGIAMIFGDAGLGPGTSYYLAQHQGNPQHCKGILFKALKLRILVLLPICLLFICMMPYAAFVLKAPLIKGGLIAIAGGLFFVQIMSRWLGKAYEGLGQADRLGRFKVFTSWLSPLSQLLLVFLGFGVPGAIGGQAFGNAVVVAILLILLLKQYTKNKVTNSRDNCPVSCAQIIRYALPLMIIHASFFIYMQSDILILNYFTSIENVSYYGLIAQLVVLIQIPALSFGNSTAPLVLSAGKESFDKASVLVRQSIKYIVIFYAPVVLFLFILAEPIITTVFSEDYLPSAGILRIYTPFIFCFAISGFVSLALDYSGKARTRMVFVSTSAIINVALNLWLIPKFGMVGAAWATQATYVPLVAIYLYLITTYYRISLKGAPVFLIKLFCCLVLSGALLIAAKQVISSRYVLLVAASLSFFICYSSMILLAKLVRIFEISSVVKIAGN